MQKISKITEKMVAFLTKRSMIIIALVALVLLCMVIAPLLAIAWYSYPAGDDFGFGIYTYKAFKETGSIWEVLKAAGETVKNYYMSWQGTFMTTFLASLQPGIWGLEMYGIGACTIILSIVFSQVYLAKVTLVDMCHTTKMNAFIIVAFMLCNQILWVPYPRKVFYWYTGAMAYGLFFAFSMIYIALMLKVSLSGKVFYIILSALFGILLGGGNYPSALICVEISVLFLIYGFFWKRKYLVKMLPGSLCLIIAFLVNVLSPGNMNRQAVSTSMPALVSILKSLYEGASFIGRWSTLHIVLGFLLLLPFLWKVTATCKFDFRFPVIASVLSFGIFSSQFTPTLYAQSHTGPGRLQDIIFFAYFILVLFNIIYWMGWFRKKIEKLLVDEQSLLHSLKEKFTFSFKKYLLPYCGVILIFYSFVIPHYGYQDASSFSAYYAIRNGEAKQYQLDWQNRYEILMDETQQEVALPKLSVWPYLLCGDDIETDAENWENRSFADYWDKEKVWIEE